jgi:CBS domain-containing protein
MAKTAREVMTGGVECVGENETVLDAAKKLADLDVGSMPICGEDNRLKGMLTDRDIVVKVLAAGKDAAGRGRGPGGNRGRARRDAALGAFALQLDLG